MPIFVVKHKTSPLPRLIEAKSKNAVRQIIYAEQYEEPRPAKREDLAQALDQGIKVEK